MWQIDRLFWWFQTRPLIEEHVLNATKTLLTDEFIPDVTLLINDAIQTAVAMAEKRVAQEIEGLKVSIASKDAKIDQLEQRLNVNNL